MKSILFITFFTFGCLLLQARAEALSPPACVYEQNCSEKEYCSWRNTSRNWPKDTGYRDDCSNLSDERPNSPNLALIGGGVVVVVFSFFVVLRIIKYNRKSKKI